MLLQALACSTTLAFHSHTARSNSVGVLCDVFGIILYGSPLTVMMSVLPSVQPFHAIAYPLDLIVALEIRFYRVAASMHNTAQLLHPDTLYLHLVTHLRLQ